MFQRYLQAKQSLRQIPRGARQHFLASVRGHGQTQHPSRAPQVPPVRHRLRLRGRREQTGEESPVRQGHPYSRRMDGRRKSELRLLSVLHVRQLVRVESFQKRKGSASFRPEAPLRRSRARSAFGVWVHVVREHISRFAVEEGPGVAVSLLLGPDRYSYESFV